jgi:hypothetical protein
MPAQPLDSAAISQEYMMLIEDYAHAMPPLPPPDPASYWAAQRQLRHMKGRMELYLERSGGHLPGRQALVMRKAIANIDQLCQAMPSPVIDR